jgi:hypothetical protein
MVRGRHNKVYDPIDLHHVIVTGASFGPLLLVGGS